ncbi:uncharacterized protein PHALS_05859 [Plasmopara halstedii]|uniref:Uncharacterized protein n=1 Tax=Plasmopara halstedii TaxID=4781 RepID=A0A0P1ABJ1_PLAHL|nr:uncharacterized protein PHALS_05859 [Plasmopara halstedii]CEG37804.1 hypothetical protein PHALS_05859 [Plasmopara halstedii]|eukprot:XP_024574173.1 hypothetical protein PHALS_05859 [Plasmopara halstedii]
MYPDADIRLPKKFDQNMLESRSKRLLDRCSAECSESFKTLRVARAKLAAFI